MARTKEFDEDAVLLKGMRLFWEQGYEKTSIQELVSHMGIHKGSMYDTFGDKQSLYVKALKRYSEMLEQSVKRRMADTRSAKEAIRLLFEIAIQQREEFPEGCFIVNTAVELAKHDSEARECVHLNWARTEQLIRDLIVVGQQSGELSQTHNAEWLSYYFNNALIGLLVMVKTITDREKLRQIIEMNMSVLE
ncbi:TetR/AcrR family transcriptional regulator [Paenibacillus sp. WQ 127069]|uniref:TetR/AcrR family transcriptional regulator n=1 Tax=Paenibacillus baimaensis TaxID=2982185 RepID=A0ABT2UB19_9BACL|nr:TetR/AcrR family transcriptional regulator [Paenibacillus sp. WQ 127069]MCU6791838.1 TetR/AcrR family transcriptional regulator [Paenibacillus sp. WQ 127069]